MGCEGKYREQNARWIAEKSDEVLLLNLQNIADNGIGDWYQHDSLLHRAYMRACREEAHRRGLKLPDFNPYAEAS